METQTFLKATLAMTLSASLAAPGYVSASPIAVPPASRAEARQLVLNRATYETDTSIEVERLVLESGGVLRVSNGARWHAKTVVLEIRGAFQVDGRGTPGAAGSSAGEWKSSGPCQIAFGFGPGEVAHRDWQAAGGHPNDRGTNGSAGGNGAIVTIEYELVVFSGTSGQPGVFPAFLTTGGSGGSGGRGRKLICGCHPNDEKFGPDGAPGTRGQDGAFILRQVGR